MSSELGRYTLPVPTSTEEANRLTLQHQVWVLQHDDQLCATPFDITQPQHVLDLCCGTGVWTRAFAIAHPTSTVLGVDISPPRSSNATAPPEDTKIRTSNLEFAFGDAEGNWDFATDRPPFTFIYGRMLSNSIRLWDHAFKQAATLLAPGGYLELNDVVHGFFAEDAAITEAHSSMMRWWRIVFQAASISNGIDVNAVYKHAGRIREAGFRLHRASLVRWYFGGGRRPTLRENTIADLWLRDIESLVPLLTENAISQDALKAVTPEEARALGKDAILDIKANGVKRGYYMDFNIIVAQKES